MEAGAASAEAQGKSKAIPWVERYRPKSVSEVSSQEGVVRTLEKAIEQGSLPHLLFYGPPGTGKTSTALALSRALYGPTLYKSRILEMNASDERGIQVVRDKIKNFAQGAVGLATTPGYPCPPFKIIILDEADSMTRDAQAALRRTIENYSKVTRFCLICNYVSRIIEPLASRCAKFRYKPLSNECMIARLRYIAGEEKIEVPDEVLDKILAVANGDMRKAVTTLQSVFTLFGTSGSVTAAAVEEVAGIVSEEVMQKLWAAIRSNAFDNLQAVLSDVFLEGYSASTIMDHLLEDIRRLPDASDLQKGKMCLTLGRVDKCIVDGASDNIQLLDGAAEIMRILAAS
eukprot:CAMPEP_0118989104 /NCGR_PEP_ID=MMETSP1173-20130426/47361_1 /TAXON_ID=1034831 /ORGANISM="Rhizochromulina marina cf, Strain CCMP1243" /LENGTH=343 /DNA_ID=CAMNT_0006940069 /DNA_START=5 /DNA_END=1036 /DNA_ORIENTATION=+